jgi:hypothetical protein
MADKKKKPDFVFDDGTEVIFDFTKITVQEWRDFGTRNDKEAEDALMAKVGGFDPKKIPSANFVENHKLLRAFFDKAANPLDDPS